MTKKILFICGSLNQTTIMHKIAQHLQKDYDCYFTPFYADGFLRRLSVLGVLDFSILGGRHRKNTETYLRENYLKIDYRGESHDYDLVVTGTDLIIQNNIRKKRLILVQEGIIESENLFYYLARYLKFPRFLANTATTGLSDAYDLFCVGSPGYRDLFIRRGVNPYKMAVTGMPNFDDFARYQDNNFPHKNYVLVATSSARETFQKDNRIHFLKQVRRMTEGKEVVFKLHPNEKQPRARREIRRYFPDAMIYDNGPTNEMIANCDMLITQYSTVTFAGLALGKEVYSYMKLDKLRKLVPTQNGGTSAQKISQICRQIIQIPVAELKANKRRYRPGRGWARLDAI